MQKTAYEMRISDWSSDVCSSDLLAQKYRTEGTAMFSLMRNIGSSIGISIVMTLFAQNTQINHATIAESVTPFRELVPRAWLPQIWDWGTTAGAVALNGAEIGRAHV